MLDLLHWDDVVARGFDAGLYLVMALVGTALFLIRILLTLIMGDGGDDLDADVDAGDVHGDFSMFSSLSILAFLLGAGWMGLAARIDWDLGSVAAALVATGSGLAMMLASSGLVFGIKRLNSEGRYDVQTAVGRTGNVYLNIPAQGKGRGQVEVNVSGRRKIVGAVSDGEAIAAFTEVVVVESRDDETLVVRPKYPDSEEN